MNNYQLYLYSSGHIKLLTPKLVLHLKKISQNLEAKEITRNTEELITLDSKGQPHSIFQKRITGAK